MSFSIAVVGAAGRMGQAIVAAARERGVSVAATADAGDDVAAAVAAADVTVDFSHHTATRSVLEAAVKLGKAVVIGTTGHAPESRDQLRALARETRTVWAGNFSVGVNLLFHLVGRAAKALPEGFDVEIVEMHHRFKKDAPSGTAVRLAEVVLEGLGLGPDALVHGREGVPGERPAREVGMHALRGGDVVGDHTVVFAALGERVELTHKASNRAIFARGAVHAAQWLLDRPNGLYDMQDVLGLHEKTGPGTAAAP
ncbi:4-hydroxy-tetrahydrodipicolinate reductase [Congregicoccus parvus]|uniref:4-hydroxy-tetrahydrodipicolinate reductase n=1 Tax=Congregicoccus parvus TaxID=3081749 RepID=UPI003FA548A7